MARPANRRKNRDGLEKEYEYSLDTVQILAPWVAAISNFDHPAEPTPRPSNPEPDLPSKSSTNRKMRTVKEIKS
jgi:hypothetical protein